KGLVSSTFSYLNIFNYFNAAKDKKIIIVGLDGAGKTTIFQNLSPSAKPAGTPPQETLPTIGCDVQKCKINKIQFEIWDLGGQTTFRKYWSCYYDMVDAVVFVVDSVDKDRISIVRDEYLSILSEQKLSNAIILVLANKMDIPESMELSEINNILELPSTKHTYSIFATNALTMSGVSEAFEWLSIELKKKD
ncbi:MAG: Arf GTPase arl1, partial [Marteilia pararefringens]